MSNPSAGGLSLIDRNPIAVRAAVTAAATALVHVLVVLGVLGLTAAAETAIGGAVDAGGLVVLLVWSIRSVTPNAKVITAVTSAGEVVAGDAAVLPTGAVVGTISTSALSDQVATKPVRVKPELVATAP